MQQVAVYRGFKPFLLQVWAMQTIRDYLDSGADKAAGAGIGPFQAQALALVRVRRVQLHDAQRGAEALELRHPPVSYTHLTLPTKA